MEKYQKKTIQIYSFIFIILIFSSFLVVYNLLSQQDQREQYRQFISSTKTAFVKTQNAPTATMTLTPSPTSTATTTPTIVPTHTPEPPCQVLTSGLTYIYPMPSYGRSRGGVELKYSDLVQIYGKITNEPWYLASTIDQSTPSGWIYQDNLKNVNCKIPDIGIEQLLKLNSEPGIPIVADTFSDLEYSWSTNNREFKDGNILLKVPYSYTPIIVTLEKIQIPQQFDIFTSFTRVQSRTNLYGYTNIRLINIENSQSYIELRLKRNDSCDYQYFWKLEDGSEIETLWVPLGESSGCEVDQQSYLHVRVRQNINGEIEIDGEYNNEYLSLVRINNESFSNWYFAFGAFEGESIFDYLVVSKPN